VRCLLIGADDVFARLGPFLGRVNGGSAVDNVISVLDVENLGTKSEQRLLQQPICHELKERPYPVLSLGGAHRLPGRSVLTDRQLPHRKPPAELAVLGGERLAAFRDLGVLRIVGVPGIVLRVGALALLALMEAEPVLGVGLELDLGERDGFVGAVGCFWAECQSDADAD
jgi:hypothetical protein